MTFDASEVYTFLYGQGKFGTPRLGTARNRRCDGTLAFMSFLEDSSKVVVHPSQKENSDWISPVVLMEGATSRKLSDIDFMVPFICLDVDVPWWTLARLRDLFGGVKTIIHTTTTSTIDHPRWRIIVFLDRLYSADEYGSIWRYYDQALDGDLDANTKDASRISFMPKTWRGMLPATHLGDRGTSARLINYNFYANYAGVPMMIDLMLEKFPVVPVIHTETTQTRAAGVTGLVSAPGIEIIKDWMWQREMGHAPGGRMYRIMQRAARRFKMLDFNLTAAELANDFMARVNTIISPHDPRINIDHDAQNAITWASANVETLPSTHNIFQWRT